MRQGKISLGTFTTSKVGRMGKYPEIKHNELYEVSVLIHCRSYEMNKIYGAAIASKSQDYAFFHNTIFETSPGLNTLASCVTFTCKDRVPAGSLYNVSLIRDIIFIFYQTESTDWNLLKCYWC